MEEEDDLFSNLGRPASELDIASEEYERTTIYLRESLKEEFRDWLDLKGVSNVTFKRADTMEIYEAIISVAMQNEDEITEELEEIFAKHRGGDED